MIPNQWYPLVEARLLKSKPLAIKRFDMDLVLWRGKNGEATCMLDSCPHRGVALSLGHVEDGQLRCHYHGFKFERSGACTEMPSEGPDARIPKGMCAKSFEIKEKYGVLWFWWGAESASRPEIPWFDDLPNEMDGAWAWGSREWPQHYVRSVESNFDAAHFPWVHGNIAPGIGNRVYVKRADVKGDSLATEMRLYKDGTDPEKGFPFDVRFMAPSLTTLSAGSKVVGVVMDSPIDDTRTYRVARLHQSLVTLPLLDWLGSWAILKLDWSLTQDRQDRRVVKTMKPALPLEGSHKLIGADVGISKFRAIRRRLLRQQIERMDELPEHVRQDFLKTLSWAKIDVQASLRPLSAHSPGESILVGAVDEVA